VNCGSTPITVSGSINLRSLNGFLDVRLKPLIFISLTFSWLIVLYIVGWISRLVKLNPKITFHHQLFAFTCAVSSIGSTLFATFLVLWNVYDIKYFFILLLSRFLVALSRIVLVFHTFIGLERPNNILSILFVIFGVFFVITSALADLEIADLHVTTSSSWLLGFGELPWPKFLLLGVSQLLLLGLAKRCPSGEMEGMGARDRLLRTYSFSVLFFVIGFLLIMTVKTSTGIVGMQNCEWLPLLIETTSHMITLVAVGSFWMVLNPSGWAVLEGGSDALGVDVDRSKGRESLVGSGNLLKQSRHEPEYVVGDLM
jgi:hypothetical protein